MGQATGTVQRLLTSLASATQEPLYTSHVAKKGFIAVDEVATETAAAMTVGIAPAAAVLEVIPITIDRPFRYP